MQRCRNDNAEQASTSRRRSVILVGGPQVTRLASRRAGAWTPAPLPGRRRGLRRMRRAAARRSRGRRRESVEVPVGSGASSNPCSWVPTTGISVDALPSAPPRSSRTAGGRHPAACDPRGSHSPGRVGPQDSPTSPTPCWRTRPRVWTKGLVRRKLSLHPQETESRRPAFVRLAASGSRGVAEHLVSAADAEDWSTMRRQPADPLSQPTFDHPHQVGDRSFGASQNHQVPSPEAPPAATRSRPTYRVPLRVVRTHRSWPLAADGRQRHPRVC